MTREKLAESEISAWCQAHPGWSLVGDSLERTYSFEKYRACLAFVDAVGALAETKDHHPEISLEYGRVKVRWTTHDRGGVTPLDRELAELCDATSLSLLESAASEGTPQPPFGVVYKFDVKEGSETTFERAWSSVTQAIRAHLGSLGSRLHRGDGRAYFAYAQWPSREVFEGSGSLGDEVQTARAAMKDACESIVVLSKGACVKDWLLFR